MLKNHHVMSESSSSSVQSPIGKSGLGLLVPDCDTLASVSVLAENVGDSVMQEKGESELRDEIEREIYKLTLEQAEIEDLEKKSYLAGEESVQGVEVKVTDFEKSDLGEKEKKSVERDFEGGVKVSDLDEEKKDVDVVVCVERDFVCGLGKADVGEEKKVDVEGQVEKADVGVVVSSIGGGFESDLGKADLGEEKTVDVVVSSIGGDIECDLGKADLGVDKKTVDVIESVEGDVKTQEDKADLGEDKNVDVVGSVERDFESRVEKADVGEEKEGNVVESVGEAFESRVEKADVGEEKEGNVVESVGEAFESRVEKADVGEEKNVNVVESVGEAFESKVVKSDLGEEKNVNVIESGVVEGGLGLSDDFNDGKNGFSESVVGENENGVGDEESVGDQTGDEAGRGASNNQNSNNRRRSNYPMRPDAEDCTYYMKFGTCKFGLQCKFNHPPKRKTQGNKERAKPSEENSERMGQTDCKYHMTPSGCKYGRNCKYYHGSENSSISLNPELNFLGLPIRLGEKECPYYMRTGSCKYGSNCRFHHPEPTTVGGGDPGYGNGESHPSNHVPASTVPSWSSPRAYNDSSPYSPVIYPASHTAAPPNPDWNPSSNPEWNGYQGPAYQISERGLPTPPAFAMKNLPAEINYPLRPLNVMVDEYPERPGEPECSFFMKTGDCKYKSGCKFNHPKNRGLKAKARASPGPSSLSDKGLPLRPDQPICSHYHQYGICKYGPACRYDHPSNVGGLLPPPLFNQPPPFSGPDKSRKGNKNGIAA